MSIIKSLFSLKKTPLANSADKKLAFLDNKKLRLIFMGTPDFAVPALNALLKSKDIEIIAVFTQPDKAVGRKQELRATPIKKLALENQLLIFQPEKIKSAQEIIKNLQPDLIIVVAYGQIIPPAILAIPRHGCLNVHASLLPKYRGAACLNAPILNGDQESGITIMKMSTGLDTGPILRQARIKLSEQETLPELHDRLAELGASLLPETINDWVSGQIKEIPQDDSKASYVKMLSKEDGKIDWQQAALKIDQMIRALNPWPGTYTLLTNYKPPTTLKILAAKYKKLDGEKRQPGELFLHQNQLAVQCGQGILLILKLQLSGGRVLSAQEFLSGHRNLLGKVLG